MPRGTTPTRRHRRELHRWDGFPFLVLLAYMVVVTVVVEAIPEDIRPIGMGIFVLGGITILVWLWRWTARPGAAPRPLTTPEGAEFIDTEDIPVHRRTAVDESYLYRGSIAAARAWVGDDTRAILVPGVTRGLRRELRVAVQIEGNGRLYTVGYLARDIDGDWQDVLPEAPRFIRVPAHIHLTTRGTLAVDVDLSGVPDALGIAH